MYSPAVTLLDLIMSQLRKHGLFIDKAQLEVLLDKVKFILLLDGLDEVSSGRIDDFVRELINLRESYPQHVLGEC
jgi:predicted NACHT family NTPase